MIVDVLTDPSVFAKEKFLSDRLPLVAASLVTSATEATGYYKAYQSARKVAPIRHSEVKWWK